MVLVEDWEEFYEKAEELARGKPLDCRYTVKYKHRDGKMVLKVTDNAEVSQRPASRPARPPSRGRPTKRSEGGGRRGARGGSGGARLTSAARKPSPPPASRHAEGKRA